MTREVQLLSVIRLQTDIAKQGLDLGGTMALVVERVLPLLDADGAAVELLEGDEMVYRAVSGIAEHNLGLRISAARSLSGLAVRTGEVLVCTDSETDDRVDRPACRHLGLRSMVVVPLQFQQTQVGVLKAMSRRVGHFTPVHLELLGLLSELVSASMYFSTRFNSDELYHRATHDAMTGLANRALFMDRLRSATQQREREPQPFGVLLADIDGLKQVNDGLGHRAGDAMITEFAQRLARCARGTDVVARLGGDEFGVIVAPVDGENGLQTVGRRMTEALIGDMEFEGRRVPVSGSVGLALCPLDAAQPMPLLDVADSRMYAVKRVHKELAASKPSTC